MKKFLLFIAFSISMTTIFAQSEKYMKAMQDKMVAVDTTMRSDALLSLSASFERIGDAEKTQWLPYFYAALTQVNAGYMMMGGSQQGLAEKMDPIADKAEALLNKAEALKPDNSEIYVVKKMIANIRMWADPMNRYMTYGPIASQALAKAKQLNPENPRVYLLEAEDKLYTPEQFGGSKTAAKELFHVALAKFASFKTETAIDPNWGKGRTEFGLKRANQ
jgi:hypothetical protein